MWATVPARMLENKFAREIMELEDNYHGELLIEKLNEHLGKYRAKKGMLEGDLENGELEVGQVVASIKEVPSVLEVMEELVRGYYGATA